MENETGANLKNWDSAIHKAGVDLREYGFQYCRQTRIAFFNRHNPLAAKLEYCVQQLSSARRSAAKL
jgi:hypothetical protein